MRVLFVLLLCFQQAPPVPNSPATPAQCADLQRLIANTKFAIENQKVIIAEAWKAYVLASDRAAAAESAVPFSFEAFRTAVMAEQTSVIAWQDAVFKLNSLQRLLMRYEAEYDIGGC